MKINLKTIHAGLLVAAMGFMISCTPSAPDESNKAPEKQEVTKESDPLPSWNDTKTKVAIINYVQDVTNKDGANFIPVVDRIATFDNDGTLWSEQPAYFQLFYALDEVKALAPQHPEWKTTQPFKAVLDNDMGELMKQGMKGLMQIIAVTHAGMTTDQFNADVTQWIDTAQNPQTHKLYKDMIFQPMLELMDYLQDNEFKTFIVSGGGIDFMRAWAEDVYGIPKNQIIGSSLKSEYAYNNGNPTVTKLAELDFNDDKEGKPVAIQKYIGRKPVFAAGNSDGDLQMLQWTASNKLKNFELYVHHTDSVREWAYDRQSKIGMLDKGLDQANEKGWTVVDMKNDWKVVYPSGK